MRALTLSLLILSVIIGVTVADVYLQGILKGSNNRFVEQSATRNENNRLFNSQNNARGGYNVGQTDSGANSASNYDYDFTYNSNVDPADHKFKYAPTYYEGSEVVLAWTNQHGCGGNPLTDPHNLQCNIVIQYTCDTIHEDKGLDTYLHDGLNGGQPNEGDFATECSKGHPDTLTQTGNESGRHESRCYYHQCAARSRNQGLFTADQNLNGQTARFTRQNPGGNRSGLECEEERDYYPYWSPSPWRDVAYLTSELNAENVKPCEMVAKGSQNTNKLFKCVGDVTKPNDPAWKAITQEDCTAAQGTWKGYSWNLPAPECKEAPWTRDNHLGATREGYYANYTWTLPSLDDVWKGDGVTKPTETSYAKCVARIRYNITTSDYDPWQTFSESNGKERSPVVNDPTVAVGGAYPLQLAINTAQFGRTFQDRSHVFTIRRRPTAWQNKKIINLNLIGKRCNIVECYPAVEYYWVPTTPTVKTADLIHVQWTGSNTHNNGANGGDGQTGDSGTGRGGSDHHNFVLTSGESVNFPIPLDKFKDNLWEQSTCYRPAAPGTATPATIDPVSCAVTMATSGYFTSPAMNAPGKDQLDSTLNAASASLIGGVVISPSAQAVGKHYFISMRDNNFTNRDQKGFITITP